MMVDGQWLISVSDKQYFLDLFSNKPQHLCTVEAQHHIAVLAL